MSEKEYIESLIDLQNDAEEYAQLMEVRDMNDARQQEEFENSALQYFEKGLSKSAISAMAQSAVNDVLEKGNPLTVAEALSAMENFIKEVRADKRFTDYVREEAGKTPKGFVSASGAKIELAETGTAYDFSKCGDPELLELEQKLEKAKILLDAKKSFLKTVPLSGLQTLIGDELVTVYPPSKTSTSSYKISLAK